METIGTRIKKRREELEMSQETLASKLGYKTRSSIARIENDNRELPQSKIYMIAQVLQTTPAYIMGWEELNQIKKIEELELTSNELDDLVKYAIFLKSQRGNE